MPSSRTFIGILFGLAVAGAVVVQMSGLFRRDGTVITASGPKLIGVHDTPEPDQPQEGDPAAKREPMPEATAPVPRPPETMERGEPESSSLLVDVRVMSQGLPAEGVSVWLRTDEEPWQVAGHTADDGACHVPVDTASTSWLQARSLELGFSPAHRVRLGSTEALTLELMRAASLTVRTQWDDGGTAPDTALRVVKSSVRHGFDTAIVPQTGELRTDSAGQLELRVHPSVASLTMTAEDLRGDWSDSQTCLLDAEVDCEITLKLRKPSTVRVRVVDGDDQPVDGATVYAAWLKAEVKGDGLLKAVTQADGYATLGPLRLGTARIAASAAGAVGTRSLELVITDIQAVHEVELALLPSESIQGQVVWETGESAEGIRIVAILERPEDYAHAPQGDPMLRRVTKAASTVCAPDGGFVLAPVRQDDALYRVVCVPDPDCVRCLVEERGVKAGTRGLVIQLSSERVRGAFVYGTVESESGGAVDPLSIEVYRRRANESWIQDGSVIHKADSGGNYEVVGLRPGDEYALMVSGGSGMTAYIGPFEASASGAQIDVQLPSARRILVYGPPELSYPRDATGAKATALAYLAIDGFPPVSPTVVALDERGRGELFLSAAEYEIVVSQGNSKSVAVNFDASGAITEDAVEVKMIE